MTSDFDVTVTVPHVAAGIHGYLECECELQLTTIS